MKRLLLIDGSNMLFRAYYAIPAHFSTSSGQPTNAVFGFVTMLSKLLARKVPDYAAVVFDPPGGSFRLRESADYKANRERMPDDLASQLPLVDQAIQAFRFPILRITDFEADDVIATLTKRAESQGFQVIIVSADKDFSQLLTSQVSLFDGMRELMYDPEMVRKKFGVPPEQFVDFQALCGDKIDNIPGVPGVGPKTASRLLQDFGSLDQILARLEEIPGQLGRKIAEHRESALLSRRLAQLDSEVALPVDWQEFVYQSPDQTQLNQLYSELEFFSLLKAEAPSEGASASSAALGECLERPEQLLELARRPSGWALHLIAEARSFAWEPRGLALAGLDGSGGWVAPWGEEWRPAWKALFETAQGPLVVHDAKGLWRFFLQQGWSPDRSLYDTQTASYLIDPAKGLPHDLERVSKLRLQRVLPSLDELLGKGKAARTWADVPWSELWPWGLSRAVAVADLWNALQPELEQASLATLCTQEVELSRVLAGMEVQGIAVDRDGLERLSVEFRERLRQLQGEVYQLAGREFNIGSPKQLAAVLFEDLKLPVLKKTKTGYSTDAEVLERLAQSYPICRQLLDYRKFEKLITTYVDVLLREVHPQTGRVHTTFGQTVSTTGRLITSEPDLQRTPVRTEEGRRLRQLFRAAPGCQLLVADWSQIELRVLAHLSGDPALTEAFAAHLDIHRRTAGQLFGKAPEEVSKREREIAKTVNFATIYGQGANALAQNLGLSKKEAEGIIARYFEAYHGVRRWTEETVARARVSGRVTTLAGRTRMIPELYSKNTAVLQAGERMAVNTPVQGSAADICKAAMLAIDAELRQRPHLSSRMLLQIHDELVFECPESELEEMRALVSQRMEQAWSLSVPLVVDIGSGPSWEAAKD